MTRSSEITRAGRQARIVAILSSRSVHSQGELAALLATGEIYRTDPARARAAAERSAVIEDKLMQALERWEALG